MTRWIVASFLALWAGSSLLLVGFGPVARVPLRQRLERYAPGGFSSSVDPGDPEHPLVSVVAPLALTFGRGLARVVGVSDDLSRRLERARRDITPTMFRVRQLTMATACALVGLIIALALGLAPPLSVVLCAIAAAVGPLSTEQRLATANTDYQRRLLGELPVVSEQLAMLMSSGFSMPAALGRLSERHRGVCARDLRDVCARIRSGVAEDRALREWAELAGVDALGRLVNVLVLNRDAGDLSAMIAAESRATRRAAHRQLLEDIERRGQMVWIPVTVATLIPGVIFLAIPFTAALSAFGG